MKILVTGCGGMLGSAIYPTLSELGHDVRGTDLIADEPWLQSLDVRESAAVEREIDAFRPDIVLHLAAVTDLEWCELHPDAAAETNSVATAVIAGLCADKGLPMVYISTAGVFDGMKPEPYDEGDEPAPIMVYGRTKLEGEKAVRELLAQHYIVRAGWMFGGGRKDHKFVYKIVDQLAGNAAVIRAVDDKFGTMTYTADFAANLDLLLRSGNYGTYHMVCEGGCSRYDIAREIATIYGRADVPIVPVSSDYFSADYFAPRPRSEMLVNRALTNLCLNHMRPWQVALRDYLDTTVLVKDRQLVGSERTKLGLTQASGRAEA